jgi:ParB-like chromosome segregation protein Spo0J
MLEDNWQSLEVHPAAAEFPLLGGREFEELKADIKERGLLKPIVKKGNVILDGRNRLRACQELNIHPLFIEYEGNDEVDFIVGANILRRHLTSDQRVAILAKSRASAIEGAAEARRKAGVTVISAGGSGEAGSMLAEEARVGRDRARVALALRKHSPEMLDAVIRGKEKLSAAAAKSRSRHAEASKQGAQKRLNAAMKPLGDRVRAKFIRFMDAFPITEHREVRDVLRQCLRVGD